MEKGVPGKRPPPLRFPSPSTHAADRAAPAPRAVTAVNGNGWVSEERGAVGTHLRKTILRASPRDGDHATNPSGGAPHSAGTHLLQDFSTKLGSNTNASEQSPINWTGIGIL